jgi:hypothetical protein
MPRIVGRVQGRKLGKDEVVRLAKICVVVIWKWVVISFGYLKGLKLEFYAFPKFVIAVKSRISDRSLQFH